jgi:hypothetical protein
MRLAIIASLLLSWSFPMAVADEISSGQIPAFQVAETTKKKQVCYSCRTKTGQTEKVCRTGNKPPPTNHGQRTCTKL